MSLKKNLSRVEKVDSVLYFIRSAIYKAGIRDLTLPQGLSIQTGYLIPF